MAAAFSLKKFLPRFIAVALSLFYFPSASAQKSYFTAGVGYGFFEEALLPVQPMPHHEYTEHNSLARGMTYGFNIGHMVNRTAGIDLGIWYVAGSTWETFRYDSNLVSIPSKFRGNTLRIVPSLKLTWGEKHKPYIKLGIILGIATEAQFDDEYNVGNTCVISPYIITHKFSGGSSIGWQGTFGMNFLEEENISFFLEANVCRQHYEPVKETVEECGATTLTYDLVDKPNPANPDEKPKPEFPFSSIGINAGVIFLLGTKKKDTPQPAEVK